MKIIYVTLSVLPAKTANSIQVVKMCSAFSKIVKKVTLFFPTVLENSTNICHNDIYKFYGVQNNFNIKNIPIKKGKFGKYILLYKAINFSKKNNYDILYSRELEACFISIFFGLPIILELHSPIYSKSRFRYFLLKIILKSKHLIKIVVTNNAMKNRLIADYNETKKEIVVAQDSAEIIDDSSKISLPGRDCLKIGYIGHLYKGRGINLIITLAKELDDFDFHIVGGNEKDIKYWKTHAYSINNLYFHGFQEPAKIHLFRNSLDILLAPYEDKVHISSGNSNSVEWMSPLKIFEYMSSRKPIVASDLPALREVLNDKNSILVKFDDLNNWKDSLLKLKNNPILRENISKAAFEDFLNNYTWDSRAKKILSIIN